MIKRTIVLSSPSRISLSNGQMICVNLDDETKVNRAPIEDVGVVIIENQRVVFTVPVLNALADNNTTVVFCDRQMM